MAAPVVIQRKTGVDSGGSVGNIVVTFTSNVTVGNTIIVEVGMSDSTQVIFRQELRPPTDTQGNVYYLVADHGFSTPSAIGRRTYVAYNVKAGATTITMGDASDDGEAVAFEVSNLPYFAFDKTIATVFASTTSLTSGTTAATTYANELLIGGFYYASATVTVTPGAGYGNLTTVTGSPNRLNTVEQVVSATGTQAATATASGSVSGIASITTWADTGSVTPVATVSVLGAPTWNTTSGTHTVTATPAVGDLIVIIRAASGNTTNTAPTDNNSSGTYTRITGVLKGASADLMECYVRTALIASASSTVFTEAPGTTTGGGLIVYKVTGMTKVGAAAVLQSTTQANQAANTTPTLTFGASITSPNPIITANFNTSNSVSLNTHPPIGFAQGNLNVYSTPSTALFTAFNSGGSTGTVLTYGAQAAATNGSLAIELDTSGSTVTPITFITYKPAWWS